MQQTVIKYFQFLNERKIYHSPNSLAWYYKNQLFRDVDFRDKSVLDIGGGSGLTSFFAAAMGAARVDLLEPLGDGSGSVEIAKYTLLKSSTDCNSERVSLFNTTFQQFFSDSQYDIIVLHNSINHLDENACINLLNDEESYSAYKLIFEKFLSLLRKEGILIIADCSRSNFFGDLGLKSPLGWTIEWEKHQKPETWIELMQGIGFRDSKIKWTSLKQLRSVGNLVLSNPLAAYFLSSHFVIMSSR
jgi:SAM-dependent methyltransferase